MHAAQFVPIVKRLADIIKHDYQTVNLKDQYQTNHTFENPQNFLEHLGERSRLIDISIMQNSLPLKVFQEYVEESYYPILCFISQDERIFPAVIVNVNGGLEAYLYDETGEETYMQDASQLLQQLRLDSTGLVEFATPFSMHPLVSENDNQLKKVSGPVSRLFNLLGAERKDIVLIYFYAIIVSIISLSLPLGVQSIIEMISGGVIFNSIVLLITFVILGIIIAGALQVMQYFIVEVLQRRIFVKAAFEFSYRIPKVRAEAVFDSYAPELMNRFFDVLTLQKGLPKLLIDLTGAALQIIVGLLLLAFYHPFFVFFGLTLIGALTAIFYFTGPKGLKTSLIESKYKYKVAHWLEEMARTLYSFKLAGPTSLPLKKMDNYVNNYLHYRKKHFRVLMTQFINIIGFKTIVTGGLLIIGSWLVIDRQITLGQFVATEIVIILILAAVEKLITSMSNIYDMLTAVEKIGNVTDIGLEKNGGLSMRYNAKRGMSVKVKDLKYKYPGSGSYSLNGVNLEIAEGERVCIAGFNGSGKNTLAKLLSGFLDTYSGVVTLNSYSLRDIDLSSLRDTIAKNSSHEEIFDGTILENVSMGKGRVGYEDVIWALQNVGLYDMVSAMPNGLQTQLVAGGKVFSESVASKMILARCVAERPQMLILNSVLHELEKPDRLRILNFLVDKQHPWTLTCVSNDPVVMASCDRIILMQDGKVVRQGSYEELQGDELFTEILIYPYKKDDKAAS